MSKIPLLLLPLLLIGACAPPPAPPGKSVGIVPAPAPRRAMHGRNVPLQAPRPIDEQLIEAVQKGQVERVRKLLEEGANANVRYSDDGNLLRALGGVDRTRDLAIAKLLVARGADVNDAGVTQDHTPLTYAILGTSDPLPVVRFLLAKGAKVNQPMRDGTTALHLAVYWGHAEVAQELLKYSANLNARTIVPEEVRVEGLPQVEFPGGIPPQLPEPNFRDSGRTPVFGLAFHWDPKLFAILREANANFRATDDNGWTVVHYAVQAGNLPALDAFLEMGLDGNAPSRQGYRPAHAAVRPATFANQPTKMLARLRAGGADLQAKNKDGQTPLDVLRSEVDRFYREGNHGRPLGADAKQRVLAEANRVAKVLDPTAPPIVPPKPKVDALGTHHPDLLLGDLLMKRAIRVEGDRAILTLTIAKPPTVATRFTIKEILLNNYEPLTPMPQTIELRPGQTTAIGIGFPTPAAKSPLVDITWSYTQPDNVVGNGSVNEGNAIAPSFRHGERGPLEVTHSIAGRTMIFQVLSARRNGKPVSGFSKAELSLEPERYRPLPGVDALPGLVLKYRLRLLPNRRWVESQMQF